MALPAVSELFKTTFDEPLKQLVQPPGLVPAFVLIGANFVTVYPALLSQDVGFITAFNELDGPWQLAIVSILTLTLGYIILAFGPSVLRFASGEAWPTSLLNPPLHAVQDRMRKNIVDRYRATSGFSRTQAAFELRSRFPRDSDVAPTALGNVLNAITDGIHRSYHIDLTATWPHMRQAARTEKEEDLLKEIDDDQVGFLSLLNLAAVLVFFALEALLVALVVDTGSLLVPALVALLAAYIAYRAAVARVASWGDRVAAAYDIYRPKLRELLGIGKPRTIGYERKQWAAVSSGHLWDDQVDRTQYEDEPPAVVAKPTPNLSATLLSREAQGPVTVNGPGQATSEWLVDYVFVVTPAEKDTAAKSGALLVSDSDLPARIPNEPRVLKPTTNIGREVIRRGAGLRDSVRFELPNIAASSTVALHYTLAWRFTVDLTGRSATGRVELGDVGTEIGTLIRASITLHFERGGTANVVITDDRVVGTPALVGMLSGPGGSSTVRLVRASGRWTVSTRVKKGIYRLIVSLGRG